MTPQTFAGRADFQRLVVESVVWAAGEGCRSLHAWDASFVDWPWSDPALLDALKAWAKPGRQLHLLAMHYDDVMRRHPRFVHWRRDYGHCVTARAVEPELRLQGVPDRLLIADVGSDGLCLGLFDRHLWRGELSREAASCQRGLDWFDVVAQRSSDSFAPTTLGL